MSELALAPTRSDEPAIPNAFSASTDCYAFPCTIAQKGFWVLNQLTQDNPACNIAVRFSLTGPLNVTLLEQSFNEIVRRHEVLRTGFADVDGDPVQIVYPSFPVIVDIQDLSHLAGPERIRESDRLAAAEAVKPFRLTRLPLIRIGLLRLESENHILLVTVHHAVADGWSIGIIADELGAIYSALSQGKPSPLAELAIQYPDYSVWETETLTDANLSPHLAYWREKLRGANRLELPLDRPRPPRQTFCGNIASLLLPVQLADELAQLSRTERRTLFVTMLAALHVVLARWSGQSDIIIGTLIAGRDQLDLEPLIGLFVNSLVLRTNVSGDLTFGQLADRVKSTVDEAMEHRTVPFERLVEEVRPPRDARFHPLFQVNFIYQRDFVKPIRFAAIDLTPIPSKAAGSIYDLNFFLVERRDGWRASIEYNTDLYNEVTIVGILQWFQAVLKDAVGSPGTRLLEMATGPQVSARSTQSPAKAPLEMAVGRRMHSTLSTESKLTAVWEKVLGISAVTPTANFFDLGGHSLSAVRLISQVEKAFGQRISLTQFLEIPTVRQMAQWLDTDERDADRPIVIALREEGFRPPLFLIHGIGGSVVGLTTLLRWLDPDQPVYAVQSPDTGFACLEDMAATYLKEIIRLHPTGPYCFLGHSLGGMIAFEMAQQLYASGRSVGLLGMLDTFQVGYYRALTADQPIRTRYRSAVRALKLHLANLKGEPNWLAYFKNRVWSKATKWMLNYRVRTGRAFPSKMGTVDIRNAFAVRSYKPKCYPGSLVLFRARQRDEGDHYDYLLGWGGLAEDGIEVFDVPGSHFDMTREPNVRLLADRLSRCLGRVKASLSPDAVPRTT